MLRPSSETLNASFPRFAQVSSTSVWTVGFALLLAAVTAVKVVLITSLGLQLSFDEAYYWHWSRHLDWCYFSKGPGIAVLVYLTTGLFGATEFGIRSGALFCSTFTLVVLFAWSRRFFASDRTAFVTSLLASSAPVYLGTGVLTTIDSPLLACWTLALAATWFAVETRRILWWTIVGVAVATGIQFKFTMLFFVASVVLLLVRTDRASFRWRGPIVALVIVAASLLPMLVWNANHDWITFSHTVDKATTQAETSLVNGRHVAGSLVQQLGVLSPVLCIALYVAFGCLVRDGVAGEVFSGRGARERRLDSRRAWFLFSMSAPMLGFYAVLSLHRMIEPNWLVAGYVALFPGAAFYWLGPLHRWRKWTLAAAVSVGIWTQLLIFAADGLYRFGWASSVFSPATGLKPKIDISNRLHGWREMAEEVSREASRIEAATGKPVFVLADHYSYAAWIGFYAGLEDRVFVLPSGRPHNQFDLWSRSGRVPRSGSVGLTVYELERSGRDASPLFTEFQVMYRTFPIRRGPVVIRNIRLDLGSDFQEERWWRMTSP